MCACINFPRYSLCLGVRLHTLSTFCQHSAVTLCPRVCDCVCVLSDPGAWPVPLLFLDNGCIYILILDYLADPEEASPSAWRMQTAITTPRSRARKSLLDAFFNFTAPNSRRQQTQRHRDRTETNLGNVTCILSFLYTEGNARRTTFAPIVSDGIQINEDCTN